jgi:signal transduction histidine kinase
MKWLLKISLFVLLPLCSSGQQNIDSLKRNLSSARNDSARYYTCKYIYDYYEERNRDSAFYYGEKTYELAKSNNKKLAAICALNNLAYQLIGFGRYAEALQHLSISFEKLEDKALDTEPTWLLFTHSFLGNNRRLLQAYTHHIFGILMRQTDNNEQAIVHFRKAKEISTAIGHERRQLMANMNLGRSYIFNNQLDSAIICENEAERLAFRLNFKKYLGQIYSIKANIYQKKNDKENEKQYYYKSAETSIEQNNLNNQSAAYFFLAKYFISKKQKDSSIYYAKKNLEIIQQLGPVSGLTVNLGTVYENIYASYQLRNEKDSIFKYQALTLKVKDSLYKIRIKTLTEFQNVSLNEQLRLQNIEKDRKEYQNKIRVYLLVTGLLIIFVAAIFLYRNNRQKQKANSVLETTLTDLKATQKQLVQSEKMASLGELTAGIAHEIQNPLNFVNNFSELNVELLEELRVKNEELGVKDEDVSELLKDIKTNSEKINHHGKRADGIVKGMLQHSRSSTGQKEATDINALCDEYLRLAYHGLRAKDKTFNAEFTTEFDETIGKINVQPQEMGRVILNLINNAFFAVAKQSEIWSAQADDSGSLASGQQPTPYTPTVTVTTKKLENTIEIKVTDNGIGIPANVKEKIFQPFFTTKPTGQGTGLGLSLAYDIVTKVHGGKLEVESEIGKGSSFIIEILMG